MFFPDCINYYYVGNESKTGWYTNGSVDVL